MASGAANQAYGVNISETIATALEGFGGLLRCTACGLETPLGNVAENMRSGWPSHCGYTMRWVTAEQLTRETGRVKSS